MQYGFWIRAYVLNLLVAQILSLHGSSNRSRP